MAKFRKLPVEIEAVRWDGDRLDEVTPWIREAIAKAPVSGTAGWLLRVNDDVHIGTLEGTMVASPGDYIIRGVKGEVYPCKPDIFAQTYEAVT
ncbi:hypothetical protein HNR26_003854 [Rhizobium rosettiformans]|uniref:Phage protein n=2 Tax=Rhizobium rosettiformans TaxID=1368430 RepID=A0A4S8PPJ5_9HYPH|nr:hypothetical protein [Rhizobium rosettiformans]MBB5277765.1 hypothetical protein [Rhizobium rosettiformans]THV32928.1 hypothetical protein FAA86_18730 [Rhizobium rosettiformans W3]